MYLCEMIGKSNIFTSTWFFSARSSFIPKFLVNFCNKICRTHTVLTRSKMQKAEGPELSEKKIQCLKGERFHTSFSYIYLTYIAIYCQCVYDVNIRIATSEMQRSQLYQQFEYSGPSTSRFDLTSTNELSKNETAAVYRFIVYYAP